MSPATRNWATSAPKSAAPDVIRTGTTATEHPGPPLLVTHRIRRVPPLRAAESAMASSASPAHEPIEATVDAVGAAVVWANTAWTRRPSAPDPEHTGAITSDEVISPASPAVASTAALSGAGFGVAGGSTPGGSVGSTGVTATHGSGPRSGSHLASDPSAGGSVTGSATAATRPEDVSDRWAGAVGAAVERPAPIMTTAAVMRAMTAILRIPAHHVSPWQERHSE